MPPDEPQPCETYEHESTHPCPMCRGMTFNRETLEALREPLEGMTRHESVAEFFKAHGLVLDESEDDDG